MSEKRSIGRIVGARIGAFPEAQPRHWLAHGPPCGWLPEGHAWLHSSGRAAIYWAFRGLRLNSCATVWMPGYHCGVEVQAVLDAGLDVRFCRVRPDLAIDLDDLEAKVTGRPGPVFAIHEGDRNIHLRRLAPSAPGPRPIFGNRPAARRDCRPSGASGA